MVFCDWLNSFSMIFSRFSQTAVGTSTWFLFKAEYYSIVRTHHVLVLCSSVDGHLDCFHFLVIMSNVAVNIPVQVFVWTYVSSAFGYILRCGLAGTYGTSVRTFLKNCQTVVQSGCTLLHSHLQHERVPVSPHPPQHSTFSVIIVFLYLLWRSVCSATLPIFKLGYLTF